MFEKIKIKLRKYHFLFSTLKSINKIRIKLVIILRAYIFLILNFFKLKKELTSEKILNIKPYKITEWRHSGIFYFLGEYNSKVVFIKYMLGSSIALNEWNAYQELSKSKLFDPKFFIKYLCYKKTKNGELVVSEFLKGKTLCEMTLNEEAKIEISQKLINIMDILYEAKIIHRDINPTNIYFEDEDKEKLKIIDFAYSLSEAENTLLKEQIKDNKILEGLNLEYNYKPFLWDDFYSLKIIFEKHFKIKSSKVDSKVGRLYYEKNTEK